MAARPPTVFRQPGVQLADGVHAIGPSRRGLSQGGYSRAYLFEDDDGLTLVDTLWDGDAHLVLEYLWRIGRSPRDVAHIVLTHAHRSHLGGLATLQALSGATVHAHELEARIVEGERPAAPVALRPVLPAELIGFRLASRLPVQPHDRCRVDDDALGEGSRVGSLEVLHLPGHTAGNLGFAWDGGRVLVAGDMVATWPSFSGGWPGFNQDERQFQGSLRRIAALRPEIVCTGHGDPVTARAAERLDTLVP